MGKDSKPGQGPKMAVYLTAQSVTLLELGRVKLLAYDGDDNEMRVQAADGKTYIVTDRGIFLWEKVEEPQV